MKICLLNFNYFPDACGHSIFVHNLASNMAKKHDVTVIFGQGNENVIKTKYNKLKLQIIDKPSQRRPSFAASIRKFLKTENFDLVITNELFSLLGTKTMNRTSTKLIHVHHGFHYEHESRFLFKNYFRVFEKKKIRKANPDKIICVDQNSLKYFSWAQTTFLPVGVDTNMFKIMKSDRKKFGLEKSDFIFLSPKILFPICGVSYIVKSFAKLDKNNAKLIIAGEGPEEKMIEALSEKLDIAHKIRFLGRVDYWSMPLLYNSVDAITFHALSGIQRTALLESLACGRPTIATNITPFNEIIDNTTNGFISEPKDIDKYADNMQKVMEMKKDRKKISYSIKDFAWKNLYKKYETVL